MTEVPSREEMVERLRQTTLYKKMLADASNEEKAFYEFKAEFADLWSSHDPPLVILRSHLIVEHFLDRYLAAANPAIRRWDDANLTFRQKLALADHPRTILHIAMPALKRLNKLRNKVAHDLSVALDRQAVAPIHDLMKWWFDAAGREVPEGTALIETFAEYMCGWIDGPRKMIERHASGHGLTGLLDWYGEEEDWEE